MKLVILSDLHCGHRAGQDSHLRADGSSTAMRGKDGEVGVWTHAGQPMRLVMGEVQS